MASPAQYPFDGDGSRKIFPIPSKILGVDYIKIHINNVAYLDTTGFDIINNSIVFKDAPASGAVLNIWVAEAVEDIANLGTTTNVDLVGASIADINTVANIVPNIVEVTSEPLKTDILNASTFATQTALDRVATGLDKVATNADVVLTHADVVLTHADVLLTNADVVATGLDKVATNADVVLTHADVVLTGADVTTAQLKAWEAEAERLTADSYATEAEDVFVNLVTSDGDGTFTYTPTLDYSSLHWNAKANALVTTAIGTTVQGYDAGLAWLDTLNFTNEATFKAGVNLEVGVDVQAYDATIVVDADIGTTVQAYDVDTAKTDVLQTFTKAQRTSATIEDNTIDFNVTNDFTITLGASLTVTVGIITGCDGQAGSIVIADVQNIAGWTGFTWLGTAPTLTTGVGMFSYKIIGSTVYIVKVENA